jgi:hypothetical protein
MLRLERINPFHSLHNPISIKIFCIKPVCTLERRTKWKPQTFQGAIKRRKLNVEHRMSNIKRQTSKVKRRTQNVEY